MKRILMALCIIALGLCSCSQDEHFGELPRTVSTFITQYWPDPGISSYTHPSADEYVVAVRNGPVITFNASYVWTSIDGGGIPLPEQLLFDQLPDPLYRYLVECEYTGQVFKIDRTPRLYTLQLLNHSLTYDPATQAVREDR